MTEWRPLAEQGDASAQTNLGVMYHQGHGVPQDYAEAMKWFRLAAEQGHPSAQTNLGVMYHQGQGVPQDYAEAMKWYRLAADQGHTNAQTNLSKVLPWLRATWGACTSAATGCRETLFKDICGHLSLRRRGMRRLSRDWNFWRNP